VSEPVPSRPEELRDEPGDHVDTAPEESRGSQRPGRHDRRSAGSRFLAGVREMAVVIVMALALSFVVKTWVLQAFFIPSGSMEDTLVLNDRVIVNKLVPRAMDLQRGDVVVFSDPDHWLSPGMAPRRSAVMQKVHDALSFVGLLPSESDDHLIKRVIGMPGDHVACCDAEGRLTVNGVPLKETYIKSGDVPSAIPFDVTVPDGMVWVMGDHRSDSEDSRYHNEPGRTGAVPISKITGRAIAIVWPWDRIGSLSNHQEIFGVVPKASPTSPAPTPTSPAATGSH
jgi:signal peptidase I